MDLLLIFGNAVVCCGIGFWMGWVAREDKADREHHEEWMREHG